MNRRRAVGSMALGVFGAGSVRSEHGKITDDQHIRATDEYLARVAEFTPEECSQIRKAICDKDPSEIEWATKFWERTSHHFYLASVYFQGPILPNINVFWQAIRTSYLLNIDGFELLQIHEKDKNRLLVPVAPKALRFVGVAGTVVSQPHFIHSIEE